MLGQSPLLTDFYLDYYLWATTGTRELDFFSHGGGLCSNLCTWVHKRQHQGWRYGLLLDEMKAQFVAAGLDPVYPFNSGPDSYMSEDHTANPDRLAWVRTHRMG